MNNNIWLARPQGTGHSQKPSVGEKTRILGEISNNPSQNSPEVNYLCKDLSDRGWHCITGVVVEELDTTKRNALLNWFISAMALYLAD